MVLLCWYIWLWTFPVSLLYRHFEQSHLGQMKTVFPGAYAFRQERNIPTFNSNIKKGSYQLTLEPVMNTGEKGTDESILIKG